MLDSTTSPFSPEWSSGKLHRRRARAGNPWASRESSDCRAWTRGRHKAASRTTRSLNMTDAGRPTTRRAAAGCGRSRTPICGLPTPAPSLRARSLWRRSPSAASSADTVFDFRSLSKDQGELRLTDDKPIWSRTDRPAFRREHLPIQLVARAWPTRQILRQPGLSPSLRCPQQRHLAATIAIRGSFHAGANGASKARADP